MMLRRKIMVEWHEKDVKKYYNNDKKQYNTCKVLKKSNIKTCKKRKIS